MVKAHCGGYPGRGFGVKSPRDSSALWWGRTRYPVWIDALLPTQRSQFSIETNPSGYLGNVARPRGGVAQQASGIMIDTQ
jgi:hypothetical protein